jgi:hypothetical protein
MLHLMRLNFLSVSVRHCPTGVTTQDPVRQKALVVPDKATRVFNFHQQTLHALQELVQVAGLQHPGEITARHIVRRVSENDVRLLATLLPKAHAASRWSCSGRPVEVAVRRVHSERRRGHEHDRLRGGPCVLIPLPSEKGNQIGDEQEPQALEKPRP